MIAYHGQPLLFVDVEASSLAPNGYPIEIGWAPDASAADGEGCGGVLVSPTPAWQEEGHWSEESAAVHRIPRDVLIREGLDVMDVMPMLERAFAGRLLVSDAIDSDLRWLAQLCDAADRPCPWRLHPLDAVRQGIVAELDLNPRTAFATLDLIEVKEPRPHRAGPDAARMARLTKVMIAGGARE
jgi:hypothetical protein